MIESKIHATFNTVTGQLSKYRNLPDLCPNPPAGLHPGMEASFPLCESASTALRHLDELQEDPLVNLCLHLPSHAFSPRSSKSGVSPKLCSKDPLHQNPPFSCGF